MPEVLRRFIFACGAFVGAFSGGIRTRAFDWDTSGRAAADAFHDGSFTGFK